MIKKDVVTCFLKYEDKIFIGLRSSKVRTYPGKWASVSGSIEEDPYQTALEEVGDEVHLTKNDVELVRVGDVLEVQDKNYDTLFRVHPYLFECKHPEKIKLDWEHTEYKWIRPEEISNFETVPKLKEAFEKVSE